MKMGRFKKLLLGLLTSIFILTCFEGVLRLSSGPPVPPIQVNSHVGLRSQWFAEQGSQAKPTYGPEKFSIHHNEVRFAFLGGSSVHGGTPNAGISQEFPAIVGHKLGVKTLNLGSPGMDSHDIRKILEQFQKYSFDAWVIYSGHNDFGNLYFFKRFKGWKASTLAGLQGFLSHLQIYSRLQHSALPQANNLLNGQRHFDHSQDTISLEQKRVALAYFKENLRRISWIAKKAGIPVLFVLPGSSLLHEPTEYCPPAEDPCIRNDFERATRLIQSNPTEAAQQLQEITDRDGIPIRIPSWARQALFQLATELGIECMDAHQLLPEEPGLSVPAKDLFIDQVHFSLKGHQVMADIIAQQLQSHFPSP